MWGSQKWNTVDEFSACAVNAARIQSKFCNHSSNESAILARIPCPPKSTEDPPWAMFLLRGGYTVHPVPAPASTNLLTNSSISAGKRNQKIMLFNRGNAISGAPSIKGTNQLPNPPIKIGITIKKIIINAWAVTTTLYSWSSPNKDPLCPSSNRIIILKPVPTIPAHTPANK